MWFLFGPVEPITSLTLLFLTKENKLLTFFSRSLLYSYCPLPYCPPEIAFFWPSTHNNFSISWQVTFPCSLITLIAFALDFSRILCSLFGLCCPNLHMALLLSETWGAQVTPYDSQPVFCITSSSLLIKKSSEFQHEHFFCFTVTLKPTRTFNTVNSTKLKEVIPNWLSSLSLHPKMTEHFKVTTGKT